MDRSAARRPPPKAYAWRAAVTPCSLPMTRSGSILTGTRTVCRWASVPPKRLVATNVAPERAVASTPPSSLSLSLFLASTSSLSCTHSTPYRPLPPTSPTAPQLSNHGWLHWGKVKGSKDVYCQCTVFDADSIYGANSPRCLVRMRLSCTSSSALGAALTCADPKQRSDFIEDEEETGPFKLLPHHGNQRKPALLMKDCAVFTKIRLHVCLKHGAGPLAGAQNDKGGPLTASPPLDRSPTRLIDVPAVAVGDGDAAHAVADAEKSRAHHS